MDSNGNQSRQLDVIISDTAQTPILFSDINKRVIPIECAYAVIEVKARIDGEEIKNIFENMSSVRALEKKSHFIDVQETVSSTGNKLRATQYYEMYGRNDWAIFPVNYFAFGFDSVSLRALKDIIDSKHKESDSKPWERVDCVCILNKGVICNQFEDNKITALPNNESKLVDVETRRALFLFYSLATYQLFKAGLPRFNMRGYIQPEDFIE